MSLESIDLLPEVAQILYNERIVEQRKEIAELKKKLKDSKNYEVYVLSCYACTFGEFHLKIFNFSILSIIRFWYKSIIPQLPYNEMINYVKIEQTPDEDYRKIIIRIHIHNNERIMYLNKPVFSFIIN